ncbi:hypothetical protein H8N03_09290 [Ramlibacter sp. USB13]|uniref:Uncharacterized protein n=1 Tax=Ramlibacter cellulosilyticus TaxID=2764187 RepID=A0A923MQQ1_9BURK|nr:hypothetical protein [Ramlibacter cellulosilyticus]MBC5783136.1 hypothetical protein [Ramlibacter cellulosilyticus]
MSNALEFPGLSLVEPEAAPAQPEAPASSAPQLGRRWSDGAGGFVPTDPNIPWSMSQQWPNLVAALSEQAVESSNLLLRALNYLVGAGRLRRSEAKALSDAMHQLRGTSLRAQQITRLAGGRIRQARERVDLSDLVRHVLHDRADEIEAAGVTVSSELQGVDVLLDPPVAISLVNAILDWAMSFSKQIHVMLSPADFPGPAQLKVRVTTPAPAHAAHPNGVGWTVRPRGRRLNDGLHWMLLRQIAASSSLEVTRTRENGAALLTIDFPKTFLSTEGMACLELTGSGDEAAPLRETWVLVIAKDEKIRGEAIDSLRKMGIDALPAADAAQARAVMRETRPNVLVTAWDVPADEIARFRQEVLGGEERCPLVEITRDLPSFHLSGFDRFETPKVGREQLTAELPPTVLFELVKVA